MSVEVLSKPAVRNLTPVAMKEPRSRGAKEGGRPVPGPQSPHAQVPAEVGELNHHFDPAHIIYDSTTDTTYLRGRLLGKGGFARCYELLDLNTNKIYAGKIIAKSRIAKPHQRQKIVREVELQRDLKHRNVVEFHSYFEDDDNVYIILENCSRKSLVHVLKHRKTLTEPEVRYYMQQLVEGVKYTHSRSIIHRDLKLGNMLLNEHMELKIADFGLATRVDFQGEKKMTVCGTPNYIAPEVLQKKGHSFEADIWALGCVMYALLVGRPPFETTTLKETYLRITENSFTIPPELSRPCREMIRKCLSPDPVHRPSLDAILADEFFTFGYMPRVLSPACCTSMPKFPVYGKGNRPLSYAVPDAKGDAVGKLGQALGQMQLKGHSEFILQEREGEPERRPSREAGVQADICHAQSRSSPSHTPSDPCPQADTSDPANNRASSPRPKCAAKLLEVLSTCLDHMPKEARGDNPSCMDDSTIVWVTKWVDYSNKYGFGFQLSTNSIGVLFNDTSRILLSPDGRSVQYYDLTGKLSAYRMECTPDDLDRKTTLLQYFARYMDEHLIQGGDLEYMRYMEPWSGSLFLKKWFRTAKAIVLYLSDGTLQVNFFEDHTKIILSHMGNDYLVTFIDPDRLAKTYNVVHIIQDGCRQEIIDRMLFARNMLKNLVDIEGDDI